MPASAPRFGGQFELTSQGDLLQLFAADTSGKRLSELKLSQSVDDSAWPTSASGTLYVTDGADDVIWKVTGPSQPGDRDRKRDTMQRHSSAFALDKIPPSPG